MIIKALATDFDGTIAQAGSVTPSTLAALKRFKESGRKIFLVTGRELHDLQLIFPMHSVFDRVVVENGAVLYDPASGSNRTLATAPPRGFVDNLRNRGVSPL